MVLRHIHTVQYEDENNEDSFAHLLTCANDVSDNVLDNCLTGCETREVISFSFMSPLAGEAAQPSLNEVFAEATIVCEATWSLIFKCKNKRLVKIN